MEQLINVLIFLMSVNIVINIWNIAVIRKAWRDGFTEGVLRPQRVLKFAETSGAGDVVTAELLAAFAKGCGIEEAANNAMEAAADYLSDAVDERRY